MLTCYLQKVEQQQRRGVEVIRKCCRIAGDAAYGHKSGTELHERASSMATTFL